MPSKFVVNAAKRADVSLETAEHRWAEAKKAVKKGKRRGSWYWGKVMNTFKRMMGLMEEVTLKEWLMFEGEGMFGHWPNTIHLYGPYVAERSAEETNYVMYDVEEMIIGPTGIQLSASAEGGKGPNAVFTLGYKNDFAQGLGVITDADSAGDVKKFREWATFAMKQEAYRFGLNEGLHAPPFRKLVDHLPDKFYIGKGIFAELRDNKPDRRFYLLHQLMNDAPIGILILFRRKPNLYMAVHKMNEAGLAGAQVQVVHVQEFDEHGIKEFVKANPPIMLESFNPQAPAMSIPDDIFLQQGYYLECYQRDERSVRFRVKRLMNDEDKAAGYEVVAIVGNDKVMWVVRHQQVSNFHRSVHVPLDYVDSLVSIKTWLWNTLSQEVGLSEATLGTTKAFVSARPLAEAKATSRKDTRAEPEWLPFVVGPISGKWPVARDDLWLALDDAFGNDKDWNIKDKNEVHSEKWKNNLPVTYVHLATAKLNYAKLRAHGYQLHFMEAKAQIT